MKKITFLLSFITVILFNHSIFSQASFTGGTVGDGNGSAWNYNSVIEHPVSGDLYAMWRDGSGTAAVYKLMRWNGTAWTVTGSFNMTSVLSATDFNSASDDVSLAIGSTGTFHVAFRGIDHRVACCSQPRGIVYAYSSNGTSWSFEKVSSYSTSGGSQNTDDPIIRVTNSGVVHIGAQFRNSSNPVSYAGQSYNRLYTIVHHRRDAANTWVTSYPYFQGGASNEVDDFSMALDTSGNPHFAWQAEVNGSGLDGNLMYTVYTGSGSQTATAANGRDAGWAAPTTIITGATSAAEGRNNDIEIDPTDNSVHIMSYGPAGIKYSKKSTGSFATTLINGTSSDDFIQQNFFNINSNGNKYLFFIDYNSTTFVSTYRTASLTTGTTWAISSGSFTPTSGGSFPSSLVSSSGTSMVMYNGPNVSGGGDRQLFYATGALVSSTAPTVTTTAQTLITTASADLGGNVTSDGGATVTDRGIVWHTSTNPTTANNKVANGTGTGTFSAAVRSLPTNTTIYARAYAINSAGTSYGSNISFTTQQLATSNFAGLGANDSGGSGFKTNTNNTNYVISNLMKQDGTSMYIGDNSAGAKTYTIKTDGTNAESFSVNALNVKSYNGGGLRQVFDQTSTIVFKDKNGATLRTMTLNADKELPFDAISLFSFFDNNTASPVDLVAEIIVNVVPAVGGQNTENWTPTGITISNIVAPSTVPTITFANINKSYGEANFNLGATSNSAGAITYAIVPGGTGTATLSGTGNKTVTLGNAGTVTIRATQAANGIYASGTKDITLTIGKKALTVTANSGLSKVYGATDPTLTYTITGFVNGDVEGDLDTPVSISRASGENVANYVVTPASATDTNYSVSFVTTTFGITQAALTVTANSGLSKVYGATDPTLTYTITGFVNGDVEGDLDTPVSISRASGENVANYVVTPASAADTNYSVSFVTTTFGITQAALTVTANSGLSKVYGATDPTLTYTITGFVNGDVEGDLDTPVSISRAAGENVANYVVTPASAADTNYSVSFVTTTFGITQAALTVTANSGLSKVYGATDPTLTYTITGFVNGDVEGDLDTPVSISRASGEFVANYVVTPASAADANYSISFVTTTFGITQAVLTVTADSGLSKVYGATDPTLNLYHYRICKWRCRRRFRYTSKYFKSSRRECSQLCCYASISSRYQLFSKLCNEHLWDYTSSINSNS